MKTAPLLVEQLEHEHKVLEKLVDDLRESVQQVLRGECEFLELREDFEAFLSVAEEELYEHFDREEQVLFPFVLEVLADSEEMIARLENAHDRMCGAMSRMARIVELSDDEFLQSQETLVALFARFDANFGRHTQEEVTLFRSLGLQLQPDQQERLRQLMAEI